MIISKFREATGSGTSPPASTHPRPPANPEDQPRLALEGLVPHLLAAALRPARTRLTSTTSPSGERNTSPGAVGTGAHPGTPGTTTRPPPPAKQTPHPKPGNGTFSNRTSETLND